MTQYDDEQQREEAGDPSTRSRDRLALDAGEIIGDHYLLEKMLGEGGFGQVWLARDRRTKMRVAVKIVPGSYAMDSGWYEAQVMRRIKQDGVAHLLDEGRDLERQLSFLVMNVVDGDPFPGQIGQDDAHEEASSTRQVVSWRTLARPVIRLCEVLHAMHCRGIVHLDLKPQNVLVEIDEASGEAQVTVLDFGLSRQLLQGSVSTTISGTMGYISPEQLRRQSTSIRSDIYTLGVMLYEALTGELPREVKASLRHQIRALVREEVPSLDAHADKLVEPVPESIATIIMHMLELDPARRPESLLEVRAAFVALMEGPVQRPHGDRGELDPAPAFSSAGLWGRLIAAQHSELSPEREGGLDWRIQVTALHRPQDTLAMVRMLEQHHPGRPVLWMRGGTQATNGVARKAPDRLAHQAPLAMIWGLLDELVRQTGDAVQVQAFQDLRARTFAGIEEVRAHVEQMLCTGRLDASADGVTHAAPLIVVEQWRCDAWSWAWLQELEVDRLFLCHHGGVECTPLRISEESLLEIFLGQELWRHLRTRAARALHEQTGGELFSVWRTLQEWGQLGVVSQVKTELNEERYLLSEQGVRRIERGVRGSWEGELILPEAFLGEVLCRESLAWAMLGKGKLDRAQCIRLVMERCARPLWEVELWLDTLEESGVVVMGAHTHRIFVEPLFSLLEVWSQAELEAHHERFASLLDELEPARIGHLILARQYARAHDEALEMIEGLDRIGRTADAIDVLAEVLTYVRYLEDGESKGKRLVSRWASLAMLCEDVELLETFLMASSRYTALGIEDIVELVTLLRAQHRRSNQAFDVEYLQAHLPEVFEDPYLEVCRLQLFYRAVGRDLEATTLFLEEVRPWFERQDDEIRMMHTSWLALALRDRGAFEESADLHEQVLDRRKALGLDLDAAMSIYNLCTMSLNALDYERARRCYEQHVELFQGIQGEVVVMMQQLVRRICYLLEEPGLEPLENLNEAFSSKSSINEGLLLLNEAAIAWRAGASSLTRSYAERAQQVWRTFGSLELEVLSYALGAQAGAERWLDFDGLTQRLAQMRWPRLVIQICGLWAIRDGEGMEEEARATLRQIVTQRLRDVPRRERHRRLEVLSVSEACAALGLEA